MNHCGFNIEPFCSDVCGDHRRPQTLAEICRNMDSRCGFRAVAAREKYPGLTLLKFGHMHLGGMGHKYFSPHCCKCNSFGCTVAIRCANTCRGPHSDSLYSGSEHRQFNSPRLVKREAGFPNPRRALIGSIQLWRVDDSPYYREY